MNRNVLTTTALLAATLTAAAAALSTTASAASVNTALGNKPGAFVTQSIVKVRLEKMMGLVNARFLQKNFGTVSTLQNAGGVVAVTGCRPHDCASNGSLVVYDLKHDTFKVWLTINDKTRVFQDKAFVMPSTLNKDVKTYISTMTE